MLGLVIALVLCVALGGAVVAIVAMPARREGRGVLAPRGEEVVERVKEAATSAKEAATSAKETARDAAGSAKDAAGERLGSKGSSTD